MVPTCISQNPVVFKQWIPPPLHFKLALVRNRINQSTSPENTEVLCLQAHLYSDVSIMSPVGTSFSLPLSNALLYLQWLYSQGGCSTIRERWLSATPAWLWIALMISGVSIFFRIVTAKVPGRAVIDPVWVRALNPSLWPGGNCACVKRALLGSAPPEPRNIKMGVEANAVRAPTIRPGTHHSCTQRLPSGSTHDCLGLPWEKGSCSTHAQSMAELSGS